jgi:hypothetical protein
MMVLGRPVLYVTSTERLAAPKDLQQGDVLAAIPLDMAFSQAKQGGNASMEVRQLA